MRKLVRFVNKCVNKYVTVDYPIGIQLGALAVMLIIFGVLYLLKNRFLPIMLFWTCAALIF